MLLNHTQNQMLLEAVELLNQADALVQKALGASDECYYIHTQIENAAEDLLDYLREHNPEEID